MVKMVGAMGRVAQYTVIFKPQFQQMVRCINERERERLEPSKVVISTPNLPPISLHPLLNYATVHVQLYIKHAYINGKDRASVTC